MTHTNLPISAALFACAILTGCDSGPSEADIKAASNAQPLLAVLGVEITDIEKHKCVEASEGRYRCTFKATARNKATGFLNSAEESGLFEQRGDTWAVIKE